MSSDIRRTSFTLGLYTSLSHLLLDVLNSVIQQKAVLLFRPLLVADAVESAPPLWRLDPEEHVRGDVLAELSRSSFASKQKGFSLFLV